MENFKMPVKNENKDNLFEQIRNAFKNLDFSHAELVKLFNEKYKDVDSLRLINQNGEPYRDKEDELSPLVNLKDVSENDKAAHIYGLILKKFEDNQVDYVKKLSEEEELLNLASEKGSNLKNMVEEYIKNNG